MSLLFPGSPSGKLTVAEHRTSVLRAMESLSLCPLSSSGQHEVASLVARTLISHIKQEGEPVWAWLLRGVQCLTVCVSLQCMEPQLSLLLTS